jgi:streptogramin lyase
MRRSAWLVLAVSMLVCAPGAAAATPEYFTFPAGYGVDDWGVTSDGAGNVWFTAKGPSHVSPASDTQPTPSLGRLIPAQASPGTSNGIAFFPLPDPTSVNCCANQARGVTFNPADGKLYYVRDDGGIGSALPSALVPGTTTGFSASTLPGNVDLWDVAPSPAGGVWFTEHSASNVGPSYYGERLAYYNGSVAEGPNIAIQDGGSGLSPTRYDPEPAGVAVDKAGRPWFVEEDASDHGYRVATYGGAGDHYDEYMVSPCEGTTPCSGSNTGQALTDVAIAPDGGIWFTNYLNRKLGRFDPASHQMVQYSLAAIDPSLAGGLPWHIIAAPDGTLWVTVRPSSYGGPGNAIVRIVPSATPTGTVTLLPTDAFALGIGADNAGNIWFATSDNKLGRLVGVVGVTPVPPADPGTGVTPPPTPAAPVNPPSTPPVVLKPVSIGTSTLTPPQTDNGAVNTNQICVGPPEARCSLVYLIKEHEYVTGFPSSVNKKHKKHQPRLLGTKTVTLHGGQKAKVTVKLNKLGKRILKGKHKLKIDFSATQKLANGKTKTVTKKTLTLRSK